MPKRQTACGNSKKGRGKGKTVVAPAPPLPADCLDSEAVSSLNQLHDNNKLSAALVPDVVTSLEKTQENFKWLLEQKTAFKQIVADFKGIKAVPKTPRKKNAFGELVKALDTFDGYIEAARQLSVRSTTANKDDGGATEQANRGQNKERQQMQNVVDDDGEEQEPTDMEDMQMAGDNDCLRGETENMAEAEMRRNEEIGETEQYTQQAVSEHTPSDKHATHATTCTIAQTLAITTSTVIVKNEPVSPEPDDPSTLPTKPLRRSARTRIAERTSRHAPRIEHSEAAPQKSPQTAVIKKEPEEPEQSEAPQPKEHVKPKKIPPTAPVKPTLSKLNPRLAPSTAALPTTTNKLVKADSQTLLRANSRSPSRRPLAVPRPLHADKGAKNQLQNNKAQTVSDATGLIELQRQKLMHADQMKKEKVIEKALRTKQTREEHAKRVAENRQAKEIEVARRAAQLREQEEKARALAAQTANSIRAASKSPSRAPFVVPRLGSPSRAPINASSPARTPRKLGDRFIFTTANTATTPMRFRTGLGPSAPAPSLQTTTPGRTASKAARVELDSGSLARELTVQSPSRTPVHKQPTSVRTMTPPRLRLSSSDIPSKKVKNDHHQEEERRKAREVQEERERRRVREEMLMFEEQEKMLKGQKQRMVEEETKRQQAAEEEQRRKRLELERQERLKREEAAAARREQERIEKDNKLKKEKEEAEQRKKEELEMLKLKADMEKQALHNKHLHNLNQTPAAPRDTSQIDSYDMTPDKVFKPSTDTNYGIDDLSSGDETDDEEKPRKRVPKWAESHSIAQAIRLQDKHAIDPETIFGIVPEPDLQQIFCSDRAFTRRGSSAQWSSPLNQPSKGTSTINKIFKK